MKKALQNLAQEITQSLIQEIEGDRSTRNTRSDSIVDLLIPQLAEEVAKRLDKPAMSRGLSEEGIDERLRKVRERLERVRVDVGTENKPEKAGGETGLPNLKYAKSKYENLESILNYVERDEERGGVRLVIMNFND